MDANSLIPEGALWILAGVAVLLTVVVMIVLGREYLGRNRR
jgi:hypothetical protein